MHSYLMYRILKKKKEKGKKGGGEREMETEQQLKARSHGEKKMSRCSLFHNVLLSSTGA